MIDSLTAGGAEALTVRFVRAARARRDGLRVEVAFLESIGGNPFESELRAAGVPVHALEAKNLRDLAAYRRLRRLLSGRGIDVVHAHLAYASIHALLVAPGTGPGGGIPVVTTLHVRPPADGPFTREGLRRRLRVALANRRAARVVAVSESVRRAWVEEAGLDPARTTVVHNGIDVAAYDLGAERDAARSRVRRELGVDEGALLVATVAVLRGGKGLEVLIDAAPRVRERLRSPGEVRFVVAGDGRLASALAARSRAAGAGIDFAGFRSDVPALLAAADLFVLPSLEDAFPTVLLEAMAAGLPVVASRAGGIPEIVEDGESGEPTGILVPPGDPEALAEAVAGLLADPGARRSLGTAARRAARERFSAGAWLGRLERIYAEVLKEAG